MQSLLKRALRSCNHPSHDLEIGSLLWCSRKRARDPFSAVSVCFACSLCLQCWPRQVLLPRPPCQLSLRHACFMGAWGPLRDIGDICGKPSEKAWSLDRDAQRKDLGLSPHIRQNATSQARITGRGIICQRSLLVLFSILLHWTWTTCNCPPFVVSQSLRVHVEPSDCRGRAPGWGCARVIWNLNIMKGSEAQFQHLRDTGAICYSSMNQLLIHELVKDNSNVIHSQSCAELDGLIGLLMYFCNLDKQIPHFLLLKARGARPSSCHAGQ